jgi:hypothetical protein
VDDDRPLMMAAFARAFLAALLMVPSASANVIDGADDRGALVALASSLGLSAAEVQRIRKVSGHVACSGQVPKLASGALYLTNGLVLTAAHTFFHNGKRQTQCHFRAQNAGSSWIELKTGEGDARFGAVPPKPGSNADWAVVRLAAPIAGAVPFPLPLNAPKNGDRLVVISAHPAGMESIPPEMPVAQSCTVRRAPKSSSTTSFYRTDCDATQGSSGGMHLHRGADGALTFRGMTISTGPTEDPAFKGAPYDEKAGSVTTALGTDAAILAAGRALAGQ